MDVGPDRQPDGSQPRECGVVLFGMQFEAGERVFVGTVPFHQTVENRLLRQEECRGNRYPSTVGPCGENDLHDVRYDRRLTPAPGSTSVRPVHRLAEEASQVPFLRFAVR